MGLSIFNHLMGGGGENPLVTQLRDVVARNRKVRSKARRKSLRKYFGQFFAKVNIEVTRGHQRSNLAKFNISSETYHYLRNFLVRSPRKKHSIALDLFFRCHAIRFQLIEVQAAGVKKTAKQLFLAETFFTNDFRTKKASGIIRTPSCSTRHGASKHIHGDLERSGSIFNLILRSHVGISRSCCISVDASRQDKHNDTTLMSVALFNRELLAKTCW